MTFLVEGVAPAAGFGWVFKGQVGDRTAFLLWYVVLLIARNYLPVFTVRAVVQMGFHSFAPV
jgi:hypothetical protein